MAFKLEMFFGQLLYIVIIPIPQSNKLKMKKAENICLAIIWQVKTIFPNTHGLPPIPHYKKRGCLNPADIKSIQCIVGRIEDCGEWGLVNCSGPLAHAVFTEVD